MTFPIDRIVSEFFGEGVPFFMAHFLSNFQTQDVVVDPALITSHYTKGNNRMVVHHFRWLATTVFSSFPQQMEQQQLEYLPGCQYGFSDCLN